MRRTLAGVAPRRCEDCRRSHGKNASDRVNGPVVRMREWMRRTRRELEAADAGSPNDLMRECAAAAMADACGVPDDLADSILCAIEALVADGESGLEIRRRLNKPTFGIRRAAEAGVVSGLEASIMGFDGRNEG